MKHTVSIITNELAIQSGPSFVLVALLWERKRQPTPLYLPGKSHGQRNLVGYSSWGRKESDTTEHTSQLYFTFASAHIFLLRVIELKKKKKGKQSVSLFYKPYILIYSSFLKHTILELWPEVIFCTYHICVDKQDIELNNDNDKLVSERRRC